MNIFNLIKNNKIYIFILIILILMFIIFFIDINANDFNEPIIKNKKEETYVFVLKGEALIINNNKIKKRLKEQETEIVYMGDKIKTVQNSIAIIFWSDKSITRLGEKTTIDITNLNVSDDVSSIQIKFDISEGKTWSNVIRYLNNNSYFIQTNKNNNIAATVRGTVFEFNLDKNYINSINHSVKLENTEKKENANLSEGNAVMVSNLNKKIDLEIIDKIWNNWNNKEDINYINKIIEQNKKRFIEEFNKRKKSIKYRIYNLIGFNKKDINNIIKDVIINNDTKSLDNLDKIIGNTKENELQKLNKILLDFYQQINFSPNTEENIIIKSKIRNSIIKTASKDNLDMFIKDFSRLSLFDYVNASKSGLEKSKKELNEKLNQYIKIAGEKNIKNEILSNFDQNTLKQMKLNFETINNKTNLFVNTVKNENYFSKFILLIQNSFLSLIK